MGVELGDNSHKPNYYQESESPVLSRETTRRLNLRDLLDAGLDGRLSASKEKTEILDSVPGVEPATVVKSDTPEVTNFAEAKAYKKWQDAQEPEAQAAASAMQDEKARRELEQAEDLTRQAKQLAANPDAITGIPEHLK